MSIYHHGATGNTACPAYANGRALPVQYAHAQPQQQMQHQYPSAPYQQQQQQQQQQQSVRYYKKLVRLLPDCRPEEVDVKLEGRLVRIHARRHLSGEGGEDLCERTVLLPDEADASNVGARLSTDGCLLVRAPLVLRQQQQQAEHNLLHNIYGQSHHYGQQTGKLDQVAFTMQVPASDFQPEEISVRLASDGGSCRVVVLAEHLSVQLDGTRLHRSLHLEFPLPAGINPACLESRLTDQGVVEISAPPAAAGTAATAC